MPANMAMLARVLRPWTTTLVYEMITAPVDPEQALVVDACAFLFTHMVCRRLASGLSAAPDGQAAHRAPDRSVLLFGRSN
jgi:hypothetical protein